MISFIFPYLTVQEFSYILFISWLHSLFFLTNILQEYILFYKSVKLKRIGTQIENNSNNNNNQMTNLLANGRLYKYQLTLIHISIFVNDCIGCDVNKEKRLYRAYLAVLSETEPTTSRSIWDEKLRVLTTTAVLFNFIKLVGINM